MTAAANFRADSCRSLDNSLTRMLSSGMSSSNQRSVRRTLSMRKALLDIRILPIIQLAFVAERRQVERQIPRFGPGRLRVADDRLPATRGADRDPDVKTTPGPHESR